MTQPIFDSRTSNSRNGRRTLINIAGGAADEPATAPRLKRQNVIPVTPEQAGEAARDRGFR